MKKPTTFGQYVAVARQQKGWSDRQLAKKVGKVHTTIGRIEDGSIPQPDLFLALVDALDLDVIRAVTLAAPYSRIYDRIIAAQKGSDPHD